MSGGPGDGNMRPACRSERRKIPMPIPWRDLLRFYEAERTAGRKAKEIAAKLGIAPQTLANHLTAARKKRDSEEMAQGEKDQDAKLFKVNLGAPWELTGDWMICGDPHVPCTDYDLAIRMCRVAEAELPEPRKLLVAGDFWNFDSWSRYPAVVAPPTWKQEREAARALIRSWRETFAEIAFISGNHDWRRIVAANAVEDAEDLLDLLKSDGIRWSIYKYCTIASGNGVKWRVTHPRSYSQVPMSIEEKLAMKHNVNVIGFHGHRVGITMDRYGQHWIVSGGCLVDPAKLSYVTLDDTTSASMARGFVLLKNGIPHLFADGLVDWDRYR